MNKTIMFLGMLAVSFANAQQGNVGVNTDAPKATLEVQPTTTNLAGTTNEGIVAPKLSKTRVAAIATPVEGTLVYVTDDTANTIASYTGGDMKVAKIDEKGYYYFDGAEWVKAKNVAQDQEWVYDAVTNRINLRRSGDITGTFKNKVFYNVETGQFINADGETVINTEKTSIGYTNKEVDLFSLSEAQYINYSSSNNLKVRTGDRKETFKEMNYYRLNIPSEDKSNHFRGTHLNILVPENNDNKYLSVYGNTSFTYLYGSGSIGASIGHWGQQNIGNKQQITSYATALLGSTALTVNNPEADTKPINKLYGVYGRNLLNSEQATVNEVAAGIFSNSHSTNDNTLVKQYNGIKVDIISNSKKTATGTYLAGIYNRVSHAGAIKYPKIYGIYTQSYSSSQDIADELFGIFIGNIQGAKNKNYALFTNNGKVHFGDNTRIKTEIDAPTSTLTVNGLTSSFGINTFNKTTNQGSNRSVFIGATAQNIIGGTYVGFGTYADHVDNNFKTAVDNDSNSKNRFFMFNDINGGRFYFSPVIMANGTITQDFIPATESALTIVHEGKKVGIGTNTPNEKLEVVGAVKIGTTNSTCTTANAGTIRFDAGTKKFQGCTGSEWKDLHN